MIEIGDTIYKLKRNNFGYPDKEYIEIDGQTWFRYKEEKEKYTLEKYTVSGFLFKTIVGDIEIGEEYEYDTQDIIYLRNENGELISECWDKEKQEVIDYYESYFSDEQEAIKELNRRMEDSDMNTQNKKRVDEKDERV